MKKILTIAGIILLTLLIWFGGPLVGLEAVESLYLIIALALISIIVPLLRLLRSSRIAGAMENLIRKQADDQLINARPDQKQNIEAVKTQFFRSIDLLKKSKLGKGRSGAAALYELPWYMIIGPPAAGKTTLLRHSGLNFPLSDKKIQGVGGTRNCDWWFANDGIILDTAGRYAVEEEDKEEWLTFLDTLKKARKRQPINGVIVAISIEDLINGSDDEIERYAEKIRQRCDELMDKLEVVFPVYLMFTKCDLLDGFLDIFGDLTKGERERAWGCTFTDEQRSRGDLGDLFRHELNRLTRRLESWRLVKLSKERKLERRERIFLFSLQFSNLHAKIIRLVSSLFQANPYRESPVLRGFYFTCGTQEGSPIDKIIGRINPAFAGEEKKSYFIKENFTRIIFPDQNFARLTASAKSSLRMLFLGALSLTVLLTGALILGIGLSYFRNNRLIDRLDREARTVAEITWSKGADFQDNFTALDRLREEILLLEKYREEGPPLKLRFGLYKGDDYIEILHNIYISRLKEILVVPVKEVIEKKLDTFISNVDAQVGRWDSFYNTLKAYLMFTKPDKMDRPFLEKKAFQYWKKYLLDLYGVQMDERMEKIARDQVSFYLGRLDRIDEKYLLQTDSVTVRQARLELTKKPAIKSIYAVIKKEGNRKLSPLELKDMVSAEGRDVLISDGGSIPGVFSRYGYQSYTKEAILKGGAISNTGDWVLGNRRQREAAIKESQNNLIAQLHQLYLEEYLEVWKKFLQTLSISPFKTLDDMIGKLGLLSDGKSSPLVLLFKEIIKNFQIKPGKEDTAEKALDAGRKFFAKVGEKIGLVKSQEPARKPVHGNVITKERGYLALFTGVGKKKEDRKSGLENCLDNLVKLNGTFQRIADSGDPGNGVKSFTQKLFDQGSLITGTQVLSKGIKDANYLKSDLKSYLREEIGNLLLQVYNRTGTICIKAASQQLNALWKQEVYDSYKQQLYGKYPFSKKASEDAARQDVANFLMPGEGALWRFYNRELKFFITQEKNQSKVWKGFSMPFTERFWTFMKKSREIRAALFWKDKLIPKVRFWIRPHPPKSLGKTNIYISKTIIDINGQELLYENGPEIWETFSWPGEVLEKEGLAPRASLEITRGVKGYKTEKKYEGPWSFFRLLDEAEITSESKKRFKLKWTFKLEGEPIKVEADLKTESSQNPFTQGIYSGFDCPVQISSFAK